MIGCCCWQSPNKIMPKTEFTREEVAEHNTKDDIWIIIKNNVYDVTKFLSGHPGGADVIVDLAGKDGTEDFIDVGHSSDADDMMKKYKVGSLVKQDHK